VSQYQTYTWNLTEEAYGIWEVAGSGKQLNGVYIEEVTVTANNKL